MSKRKRANRVKPLALGYVRVSTMEQVSDGASIEAQRAALTAEAERRGWDLEVVADEGFSGKDLKRPGMASALDRLDVGDADILLALRLDRVSRSVADFSNLIARAGHRGWRVVVIDPSLDTGDGAGRLTAHVLSAVSEYERELIRARTREGMAQRKAEGVHCGRPRVLPHAVVQRIVDLRNAGGSIRRIAATLTSDGVATARGGPVWSASSVQAVLASTAATEFNSAT